jgi:hypothetical protein
LPRGSGRLNARMRNDWYVGWFTLALINAGLAQAKGRRGAVWFVISLLLGPLATLLVVVLEREPRALSQ